MIGPSYTAAQSEDARAIVDFGFSGKDPSRVVGRDPNLTPELIRTVVASGHK
jgi:hypothetical protein